MAGPHARAPLQILLVLIPVLLQDGADENQVVRALVPIDWLQLEPHLGRVMETGIEVAEHMTSYQERKQAAESGQAGIFTMSPAKILALLRETVRSGSIVS